MTRLAFIKLALAFGLSLGGCTNPDSTGEPFDGDDSGVGSTATLQVLNESSVTVYYAYFSPSSRSSWGSDQLGANVLAPGRTWRLNGIPCGTNYDLKLEGAGHRTLLTRRFISMTCGQTVRIRLTN